MSRFRYRQPDLPIRRDNRVVMHVVRNFITLTDVVHDMFFQGLSTDTSRKVLTRLTRRNVLNKYPLFRNLNYFRLGSHAVRRWGFPSSRTEKLGERLPYELGTLAYMCMDDKPRKRLLPHELKRRHSWFPDAPMQSAYFEDQERLGSIRVEYRGRPDRVIAKLAEQTYRYADDHNFGHLIEASGFFLVVVTATEEQELALQSEAVDQAFPVELRTANYPELIRFI